MLDWAEKLDSAALELIACGRDIVDEKACNRRDHVILAFQGIKYLDPVSVREVEDDEAELIHVRLEIGDECEEVAHLSEVLGSGAEPRQLP